MRRTPFANDEYYHVFNRGVEKREVFCDQPDYERFLFSLREFNRIEAIGSLYEQHLRERRNQIVGIGSSTPKRGVELPDNNRLVDILAYCLNPNHYHLVLRQRSEKGVEKFMQKVGTGYTNYFNQKYERSGALFQGRFKSSYIDTDEYLLHVLAYTDCNSEVHGVEKADSYPWCSYSAWGASEESAVISGRMEILSRFPDVSAYHAFARPAVDGMRDRKELER